MGGNTWCCPCPPRRLGSRRGNGPRPKQQKVLRLQCVRKPDVQNPNLSKIWTLEYSVFGHRITQPGESHASLVCFKFFHKTIKANNLSEIRMIRQLKLIYQKFCNLFSFINFKVSCLIASPCLNSSSIPGTPDPRFDNSSLKLWLIWFVLCNSYCNLLIWPWRYWVFCPAPTENPSGFWDSVPCLAKIFWSSTFFFFSSLTFLIYWLSLCISSSFYFLSF